MGFPLFQTWLCLFFCLKVSVLSFFGGLPSFGVSTKEIILHFPFFVHILLPLLVVPVMDLLDCMKTKGKKRMQLLLSRMVF